MISEYKTLFIFVLGCIITAVWYHVYTEKLINNINLNTVKLVESIDSAAHEASKMILSGLLAVNKAERKEAES